jgi:hypothetical protein
MTWTLLFIRQSAAIEKLMVVYFGKRVESERTGECVVDVRCDKCGCEYYYALTRIGSGSGTAAYGIGTAGAMRSALEQSKRDLRERLSREAELVPCPTCNWINDELVEGYRLGRYRRFGLVALSVSFFGTIASLICAWFISSGPAADRSAIPYFLIGGPILSFLLAGGMLMYRRWIRSRICPNRSFPMSPHLPPGTPPALILDGVTGQLRLAKPSQPSTAYANEWVSFQIGRNELPESCCDCLQKATVGNAYIYPVTPTINLEFPRCAKCAQNSKRTQRFIWLITTAVGAIVSGAIVRLLRLESPEVWMVFGFFMLFPCAVAAFVASAFTAPVSVTTGDEARSVVSMLFRNPEYGRIVVNKNS